MLHTPRVLIPIVLCAALIACTPAVPVTESTIEAVTTEPTEAPTEAVTTEPTTPPTRTIAPTPLPTAVPEGTIPVLDADVYTNRIEGCPWIDTTTYESLLDPLDDLVFTYRLTPPEEQWERFMVFCAFIDAGGSADLSLWIPPSFEEAQADYDEVSAFIGDEVVPVEGLGEAAFWWPLGLRLDVLHKNARLWIEFNESRPDAPQIAAALMAEALPNLDPALAAIDAPEIVVPANAPTPTIVRATDFEIQDQVLNACSLVTQTEIEAIVGPLDSPPANGYDIGEPLGSHYSCGAWNSSAHYLVHFYFGPTPAASQLTFWRGAALEPDAVPLDNLGDAARIVEAANEMTLSVAQGNILLNVNGSPASASIPPDFAQILEELARLFLDALTG